MEEEPSMKVVLLFLKRLHRHVVDVGSLIHTG